MDSQLLGFLTQQQNYFASLFFVLGISLCLLQKKPNMNLRLPTLVFLTLLLFGCQENMDLNEELDFQLDNTLESLAGRNWRSSLQLPDSDDFARIPQDPNNPLTTEKVALGKLLYHETALGITPSKEIGAGSYSCASCHAAQAGFQAGIAQGIGEGGMGFGIRGEGRTKAPSYKPEELDVQPLRSPTTLNVAYQEVMLWNGQFGATGPNARTEHAWTEGTPKAINKLGYQGVETQAIAGLEVHRMDVDSVLLDAYGYRRLFDAAFPDFPADNRYNRETAGLAIAAFERTLLANQSPFQQWLKGDKAAMTELEKEGAITFFGKADCGSCHRGPALNTMDFHAIGMGDLLDSGMEVFNVGEDDPAHLGRGGFTGRSVDHYKFKVPQLYNLKDSPFYGHGATFRSIRSVVAYKNAAVPENPDVPASQLASPFRPLQLSEEEVDAIAAFLETALYDDNLQRYVPTSLPSGSCFPNNDDISRSDLGCQ